MFSHKHHMKMQDQTWEARRRNPLISHQEQWQGLANTDFAWTFSRLLTAKWFWINPCFWFVKSLSIHTVVLPTQVLALLKLLSDSSSGWSQCPFCETHMSSFFALLCTLPGTIDSIRSSHSSLGISFCKLKDSSQFRFVPSGGLPFQPKILVASIFFF